MFERVTNRARRVIELAEEEARVLTQLRRHRAPPARPHPRGRGRGSQGTRIAGDQPGGCPPASEEIIGEGQQAPSKRIPYTPGAKKALELSLREALQLGHHYTGTEHILLGLIREGEGPAAQVLVNLGGDLNRVRQQVIRLLHGYQDENDPGRVRAALRTGKTGRGKRKLLSQLLGHLDSIGSRACWPSSAASAPDRTSATSTRKSRRSSTTKNRDRHTGLRECRGAAR